MPEASKPLELWCDKFDEADDYDYEQHMLTEAKSREIMELGGNRQQIFVIAPSTLSELEQDPYFTGELEKNLDQLSPAERALCLKLRECDSLSSGSVSDVEDIIEAIISPELLGTDNVGFPSYDINSEDAQSTKTACQSSDDAVTDILGTALAEYMDEDLDEALHKMDPDEDDFVTSQDGQDSLDVAEVHIVNECAKVYSEAARMAPVKRTMFAAQQNREFIEQAVMRQLEEEDDTMAAKCIVPQHDVGVGSDVLEFDKTLLVNMASAETARQSQRPIVNLTQAKRVDVADLIF